MTALIVPKNLGYAGIAGVPLENGLYAAAAGALIYALFCTSRQISTGPSSSLAAVAGGAVIFAGVAGDQAAQLVAAITLVTGLLFLLLWVFKLGWIAQFLSKAVVTGFLAGAAVDVVIGELPKLTGTSSEGDSAWRELGSWLRTLGDIHWTTLLVGVCALAVILALRFFEPAIPGALVLVVGGLLASALFDLGAHGVALVGDVPRGLPAPALPDYDVIRQNLSVIGIASAALLLIGFSQTAGDARAFATRHRYRIDVNQESIAQGMANAGAGCVPGDAGVDEPVRKLAERVGGGADAGRVARDRRARPGDADRAGAAVLAAAEGGSGGDHHRRRRLRDDRHPRAGRLIASRGSTSGSRRRRSSRCSRPASSPASLIGVVLSLGWLVYVATQPSMPLLAREPGTQVFRDLDDHPDDEILAGVAVLRLDGGLFFATAESLENRIRMLVDKAPLRALVLDLEGVNFIDSQGSAELAEIHELLEAEGIAFRLARVKPHVLAVLSADGVVELIGADHIHGNVHRAVQAESDLASLHG